MGDPGAGGSGTALSSLLPPGIELPKIQNVVATCYLNVPLDLQELNSRLKNAEYNPRRFKAVIIRNAEPKATALVFHTGRIVVTGTKGEQKARECARFFAKRIKKALGFGDELKFSEFRIQNVVGSSEVGFPVRLEGLKLTHSKVCRYEPEIFPGAIYYLGDPKVVLLIFVSGKVVITGAKSESMVSEAFCKMFVLLQEFQMARSEVDAEKARVKQQVQEKKKGK
ncbi:unnamed protein product [Pedinophyceae sp. YPF-701]|nr:unnamed protein product [Pedinophyceae sp. YPF-701]